MTLRYAVGIKIRNKTDQVTVEAEDALIAALKVKTTHPEARSHTCASETPAAIDAIRMPARSARTWFSRPQDMRLSQAHLIGGREAGTAAAGGWVLPIRQHLPVG